MSNEERDSEVVALDQMAFQGTATVLTARDVPLGGTRALAVRRSLPQRARTLIGAWCFADHFGFHDQRPTDTMTVSPHPHTGLQTVSWLFSGEVEHQDSIGTRTMVRPGELNIMTAGAGISHSETSVPAAGRLRGFQLWLALPGRNRHTIPRFDHFRPDSVRTQNMIVRVFLGELVGITSPIRTFTSALGAEITVDGDSSVELAVDPSHEHGVIVDDGSINLFDQGLSSTDLGFVPRGRSHLRLRTTTSRPARLLLLGGRPLGEPILMWWNFLGRTHDEIVAYRAAWQQVVERTRLGESFASIAGYEGVPIPAPTLPNAVMRPRW